MTAMLLPPDLSAGSAALLLVASFFTSAMTAAFALGGGAVLLALLSLVLPVQILVPVHALVQLGSNVGRVAVQHRAVAWKRFAPFAVGAVLGALAGAQVVVALPEAVLKTILGLTILVLAFARLPKLGAIGPAGFAATGALTTFVSMFVGVSGPFNLAILSRSFSDRLQVVATLAAANATQHLLKGVVFFALGVAYAPYLPLVAGMIATGFFGTIMGTAFLKRLPERVFRTVIAVLLAAVALDLLVDGLAGLYARLA